MDDLEHWNLHDEFTGHQAAALAVGLEPARFYDEHGCPTLFNSPAYEAVAAAMRLAYEEARNCLDCMTTWNEGAWAVWGGDWVSPELLRSKAMHRVAMMVEYGRAADEEALGRAMKGNFFVDVFSRAELVQWFSERGERFAPKYRFDLTPSPPPATAEAQQGKPLATTERNTLLGIIAAMAVKKYRFDPTPGARLEMLGRLRVDCEEAGVEVSDDTLRSKLREAFTLLPGAKSQT